MDHSREVTRQISAGAIVCPKTKQRLHFAGHALVTDDGNNTYPMHGTTPILVTDLATVNEYAKSSAAMNSEYTEEYLESQESWFARARTHDYRTQKSIAAFNSIFDALSDDAVCLSVGGGPARKHPRLVNMNIGPFPNVDIVGDAHCLPYADQSVDVIYCEAVFEHLHTPWQAAKEVSRVTKPGGKIFICTPFLQQYHGYPKHYQNFTITGHKLLFEREGFRILDAGTCVGPVYTVRSLVRAFLDEYSPKPFNVVFRLAWGVFSLVIAPLDLMLAKRQNAYVLANTTYLLAEKV